MYVTYTKVQKAMSYNELYYISALQYNYAFKPRTLSSSSIAHPILLQLKNYSYNLPNLQIMAVKLHSYITFQYLLYTLLQAALYINHPWGVLE